MLSVAQGAAIANRVSDELRCPEGRLRGYVHAGFASRYERDRPFHLWRGARPRLALPGRWADDPAPDPFPPRAPVEPWRIWGRPDRDLEEEGDAEEAGVGCVRLAGCALF